MIDSTVDVRFCAPTSKFFRLLLWGGILVGASALLLFYFKGAQTLDEGWYLNAAHLVQQGYRPYLDFNYTQGPVMPYLFSLLFAIIPYGLAGGRFLILCFTILTWGVALLLSWRLYGAKAALLTLWMLDIGVLAIGQYTYVATYAPTGFLLLFGVYLWLASRWRWRYLAAALILSLAVGIRISVLPVLFLFFLAILIDSNVSTKQKALIVGVGIGALLVIFVPFVAQSADRVWYNLIGFHTDRITFSQRIGVWKYVLKLSILLFLPFWILGVASLWTERSWFRNRMESQQWLLLIILSLFFVHFIPRTTAVYYHALQYPLMSILMGAWLEPIVCRGLPRCWKLGVAVIFAVAAVVSQVAAPPHYRSLNLNYAPYQDLARWRRFFDNQVENSCKTEMVTFTPILAVESGVSLPHGLEMGIFSYRPTWDVEKSLHYYSVNNPILDDLLQQSSIAAFSDFTQDRLLYGDLDEIQRTLRSEYRLTKTFPHLCPDIGAINVYLQPGCLAARPQHPLHVSWQNELTLQGLSWVSTRNQTELALFWQSPPKQMDKDYTVFIHLLNEQGELVFGYDERPCHDTCPTSSWRPGEIIRDEHWLNLPPVKEGYRLEIGLYDEQVQRLPLSQGGDALILSLADIIQP